MSSEYSQQPLAVHDIQVKPDTMNTQRLTEHTTGDSSRIRGSFKEMRSESVIQPILTDDTSKPTPSPNVISPLDVLVRGTESSGSELEQAFADDIPARTGRVRFRSRVRIASGLNRQKKKSHSEHDYLTFSSSSSSLSGSPSSSISAPLRVDTEDSVGKPGWGTLGQRVSLLARPKKRHKEPHSEVFPRINIQGTITTGDVNERTPLTNHIPDTESVHNHAQELDSAFGPWPRRLINPHWWWWHLDSIVCCHCLVEPDEEG